MENENIINEYILGNLSEEQKIDFEQRLESDQSLYEEYLLQKSMYAYLLERENRAEYTAEIDKLGNQYFPTNDRQSNISLKKTLIVVLVMIAILLTCWYLLRPKEVNLYESHANHFALHLVLKSDINTIALNAESAFNEGKFEEAIPSIQKYLESNSIDTKARLALGISYLETDQNEEAFRIFDEIGNGSSTLKDYAIWYKALYYVKKSDFTSAKEQIGALSDRDMQLNQKAQKLLTDINRMSTEQ